MAKKKQNQKDTPKVNPELEGFNIKIDPFGEIKTNYNIDKINEFLNKNVDDKKLRDRDDLKNEETLPEEQRDENDPIENKLEEIVGDEFENEELEEDNKTEDEYGIDEDYDDFTIEEDDDLTK